MSYDPDNIFAKIIRGDLPCFKVYEDDQTLAFMDINPQTRGHTLVVSKTAGVDLLNTEEEDLVAAIKTTRKVARAVDKALTPDGVLIAQLNRAAAGQTVYHTHFHIMPRWEGTELMLHNTIPADMDEIESLAKQISAAIE
jgi:histidine triad (HIT) family protein